MRKSTWLKVLVMSGLLVVVAIGSFWVAGHGPVSSAPVAQVLAGSASVSPNTPGSPTRLQVQFTTSGTGQLDPGTGQIIITLDDDFQVPSTLDRNQISLSATDVSNLSGGVSFQVARDIVAPQSVTVDFVGPENDEPEIAITVPDMLAGNNDPAIGSQGIAANATVIVVFQQSAGILNSTESGTRTVRVRISSDPVDVSLGVFIPVVVQLSSDGDPRGEPLTLAALGVEGNQSVTFWRDANGDGIREVFESDLCTVVAASDDTAACTFTVSSPPFVPVTGNDCTLPGVSNCNFINVRDGQGRVTTGENSSALTQPVINRQTFELEPTVTVSPDIAHVGDTITVSLFDYMPGSVVTSIEINGVPVATPSVAIPSSGQVIFGFTVPGVATDGTRIPTGTVRFEVFGSGGVSQDTTLTILGANLTLSHQAVVANQDLTVSGEGFTQGPAGPCVLEGNITLSNVALKIHNDSLDPHCSSQFGVAGVQLTSAGTFSLTVIVHQTNGTIPTALLTPGTYQLRVFDTQGAEGAINVDIPPRELEATPAVAQPGDVITITGRRFIADNPNGVSTSVTVEYQCGPNSRAVTAGPDSSGDFQLDLTIPTNCSVPSTNTITAIIRAGGVDTGVVEVITHDVVATPPPARPEAEPSFDLFQEPVDGATGLKADITQITDPLTGSVSSAEVGAFQARLTYPQASGNPFLPAGTRCLNVLDIREMDIPITAQNSVNDGGTVSFNGLSEEGVSAPLDLGHSLNRLTGSAVQPCPVTMQLVDLTDSDGNPIDVVPPSLTHTLLRGDARADGVVSIADALFIAQYLVGLRDACTDTVDTSCLHSVNAASVRHDGAFDRKTIADALFIAQHLVGLRDDFYNVAP